MADGYWYHGNGKIGGEFCHIKPNDKDRYGEYVKVVRCKDCKYSVYEQWVDALDIYTCNRTSLTRVCGDCSPTDFCSWGERKDEVEE